VFEKDTVPLPAPTRRAAGIPNIPSDDPSWRGLLDNCPSPAAVVVVSVTDQQRIEDENPVRAECRVHHGCTDVEPAGIPRPCVVEHVVRRTLSVHRKTLPHVEHRQTELADSWSLVALRERSQGQEQCGSAQQRPRHEQQADQERTGSDFEQPLVARGCAGQVNHRAMFGNDC
jgi:hypothetical protein